MKISDFIPKMLLGMLPWLPLTGGGAYAQSSGYDEPLYDQPLVTDASQLYSPMAIKGNPPSNLIDGNLYSYCHTFFNGYSGETIEPRPIKENHYLRISYPDGLPERLIFTFSVRNSDGGGCQPTKIAVLVSNDPDAGWVPLDTVSKEAGDFSTDGTTYTLKDAITGCEGYKYLKWECLAVNTNYGNTDAYGHCYFVIGEFQLYPCKHYDTMPLSALLESYSSPDSYQLGSYVGQVTDTTAYNTYYDVYLEAQNMVDAGTATGEEKAAEAEKLTAAKQALDASLVPLNDGLYYVVSAYDKFKSTGKPLMGWYAPLEKPVAASSDFEHRYGWTILEKRNKFMWNFSKQEDGNYYIKNEFTGKYVYKCGSPTEWTPAMLSDTPMMEQVIEALAPNGQHKIHATSDTYTLQVGYANNGSDTNTYGEIYNWYSGLNGECAWYIIPVTEADKDTAATYVEYDRIRALCSSINENVMLGNEPGQTSEALFRELLSEKENALNLLNKGFDASAVEEYKAQYERLVEMIHTVDSLGFNAITPGYYAIRTYGGATGLCFGENDGYLHLGDWNVTNPYNIWKITEGTGGKDHFLMQNVGNGKYAGGGYGSRVSAEDQPVVEQIITLADRTDGSFYLSDSYGMPNNWYYSSPVNHDASTYVGTKYKWFLHPIPDALVDSILKVQAQTRVDDSLRLAVCKAKSLIVKQSDYTADFDKPIITDASELFCNAPNSADIKMDNLLDDDISTILHTAWRSKKPVSDYHYIRINIPEGLPDTFLVRFRRRTTDAGGCMPTVIDLSVADSLNGGWTYIGTQHVYGDYTPDSDAAFFTSEPIVNAGGYKYLRWTVMAVNTNYGDYEGFGHPYFVLPTYNLYPASMTIKDTIPEELKEAVKTLSAAADQAETALKGGKATAGDVQAMLDAIDAFSNTAYSDSLLKKAIADAQDLGGKLSEGDTPFTFPQEAIDDYNATTGDAIDKALHEDVSATEKAQLIATLNKAMNDVLDKMIEPDSTVWYSILVEDQNISRETDAETLFAAGRPICTGAYNRQDGVCFYWQGGMPEDVKHAPGGRTFGWRFVSTGKAHWYKIVNVGTGWTPAGIDCIQVMPLGDGQFEMRKSATQRFAFWGGDPNTYNSITDNHSGVSVKDGDGAFKLEPVAADFSEQVAFDKGTLTPWVNPYTSFAAPSAVEEGTEIHALVPSGFKTAADGHTITELHLTLLSEKDTIPAGMPFIIKAGALTDTYNADDNEAITADFNNVIGSSVTHALLNNNGMTGTYTKIVSVPEGAIYFDHDSAVVASAANNFVVSARHAYVDPAAIAVNSRTVNPDGSITYSDGRANDLTVYFKGGVYPGIDVVGINNATIKTADTGNVWTIDGVLIRKNVKPADALRGLPRGIYIYGGRKVYVR